MVCVPFLILPISVEAAGVGTDSVTSERVTILHGTLDWGNTVYTCHRWSASLNTTLNTMEAIPCYGGMTVQSSPRTSTIL